MMNNERRYLIKAIELARANLREGGRPFGALVVCNDEVIATGVNEILATHDPTAHAELLAIRAASHQLASSDLSECVVYASGHPCPMCMAAMTMSGIKKVVYAYSNEDGAPFGLSTAAVYDELAKPFSEQAMLIKHVPVDTESVPSLYSEWASAQDKS